MKNKLLLLLSFGMSMQTITAMEGESVRETAPAKQASIPQKPTIIDVQEVINSQSKNGNRNSNQFLSPEKLLNLHQPTPQTIDMTTENNSESVDMNDVQQSATIVTPTALLVSTLKQASDSNKDNILRSITMQNQMAFKKLTNIMSDDSGKYNDDQKLLAQQARTLLIRKQPNLIQGVYPKLQALPGRFMSYFKEKLPTLTTASAKQQFTQLVVGDIIRSMPDFNEEQFTSQINAISAKYANGLDSATTLQRFTTWSSNIIQEIALLPFHVATIAGKATTIAAKGAAMTVGGIVGGGVGATHDLVRAAIVAPVAAVASIALGATTAGIAGDYVATGGKNNAQIIETVKQGLLQSTPDSASVTMLDGTKRYIKPDIEQIDPNYFSNTNSINANTSPRSYGQAALDTTAGVAAGVTAGALVAGTGLAVTAAALPVIAVNGAIQGAYNGAQDAAATFDKTSNAISRRVQATANAVGQSARYVYDQGLQLFTPSSNLTEANLHSNMQPEIPTYDNFSDTDSMNSDDSTASNDSNSGSFNNTTQQNINSASIRL